MLYHDISVVSVYGLRGTLYIEKDQDADGVSVQAEGPYEAKVADESWLRIYPEGQEPPIPGPSIGLRTHDDITAQGTHLGSVDATTSVRFLTGPGRRVRDRVPASRRVRARVPARVRRATVQITAPPGTTLELISCYGVRKGPRGWRSMRGTSRFDLR